MKKKRAKSLFVLMLVILSFFVIGIQFVDFLGITTGYNILDDPSLVGYWSFDNGDANDLSGNGNSGTVSGATWTSEGKVGGAYSFDGSNDFIQIGSGSDFSDLCIDGCTFSAWINKDDTINSNEFIVGRSTHVEDDRFFIFYTGNLDRLRFDIHENGDEIKCRTWSSPGTFVYGRWVHVVGVYDKTDVVLYQDNVEVARSSCSFSGIDEVAWQDSEDTFIGKVAVSGYSNGKIDEVMIFNKALSVSEISDIYNGNLGSRETEEPACVENWGCSDFGECLDGIKVRVCLDLNSCGTELSKPVESQSCVVNESVVEGCVENWVCGDWGECVIGIQNRDCVDLNKCRTYYNYPNDELNCEYVEPQIEFKEIVSSEGEGECRFTRVDWTDVDGKTITKASNRQRVHLTVEAKGCDGKTVKFTTFETDGLLGKDERLSLQGVISNGKVSIPILTNWEDDSIFFGLIKGNPEFVFRAETNPVGESGILGVGAAAILASCGNDIIDAGEACDGVNLDEKTCANIPAGFASGNLICKSDCSGFLVDQCVPGGTVSAVSCSQADVQAAIDSAVDGDTVIVPAGTCTWSSPGGNVPSVVVNKKIVLKGAGVGQTIIEDGTGGLSSQHMLSISGGVRVTDFNFTGIKSPGGLSQAVNTNGDYWRVDHNAFSPLNVGSARGVVANGKGVIDNNLFQDLSQGVAVFGTESGDAVYRGDIAWTRPLSFGTDNAVYVENNTWQKSTASDGALDAYGGARYVFRNNFISGTTLGHHGFDSGNYRSPISWEIYNNEFINPLSTSLASMFRSRGGTGIFFNNNLSNSPDYPWIGGIGLVNYRSCPGSSASPDKGLCDGTNPLDGNLDPSGYPCMDQNGRSPDMDGDGIQDLVPIYEWNNYVLGNEVDFGVSSTCANQGLHQQEGRDFYNDAVTFNSTTGFYESTYIDDDGSTKNWEYRPYVYPHPLRTLSSGAVSCSVPADCDDGLFCNGAEDCVGGFCQAGTPPVIDDGISCTVDSCDEVNDVVVNAPDDSICLQGYPLCTDATCNINTGCENYVPAQCNVITGLIGHWNLDEISGTTAADSSVSGNDGTLNNFVADPWASSGKIGGALSFDGINDYVEIGTTNWDLNSMTIALWFRANAFSSISNFMFGHTTVPTFGNRIQIYTNDALGLLDIGMGDSHALDLGIADLNTGQWYHVALTMSGTGGNGNYVVYLDGTEISSGSYLGLSTLGIANIGNNADVGAEDEAFDGDIDDVRLYDAVLTAQEVLDLFNEGDQCTEGVTRNCPLQLGVCSGAVETCTGGAWPGCTGADYGAGYELTESSCTDGLDNDCDGVSDSADSDCAICGNGIIEGGESCDGSDLGGESCVSQGFDSGSLGCIAVGQAWECTFDYSACVSTSATYYVAKNNPGGCNDAWAGTESQPWCTIGKAVATMVGGDDLFVKSGIYNEFITFSGLIGTAANPSVIQSFPGDSVVLEGNGGQGGRFKIELSDYVTFRGFEVRQYNQGIFVDDSNNIVIENNNVHSVGQEGIHVRQNSNYVTIQNNIIHDTRTWQFNGEGIYIGTGSAGPVDNSGFCVIRNNTIYNAVDEAIELKGGTHDCIVEGNIIYNSGSGLSAGVGAIEVNPHTVGVQFWGSNPNHTIRNNIIYDSLGGTGIYLATGVSVYNNVIYDMINTGMVIANPKSDSYSRNVYHNTIDVPSSSAISISGGTTDIRNNIGPNLADNIVTSSGLYVSTVEGSEDYHLVSGSAAIDAGVSLSGTVDSDLDGVSRPQDAGWDIGAYEFIGTPDTTPPTATAVCSPSTVTIGDPFPCTCSGTDDVAVASTSESSTSGSTSDTSVTGTFTYTCIVTDTSGNSASATDIYTVSPAPVSKCSLTNAYWGTDSTTEGQVVNLTVEGSNCDGELIDFEVWEQDILSPDDPAINNPSNGFFISGKAVSLWTAEWQNDCGGLCNPPEYYFDAILSLDNSVSINSNLLEVFQRNVTGNIINALSCSQVDVQNAIDNAVDGDTVLVPAGTCTWSSQVLVDNKGITLEGAGIGVTTINLGISSDILRFNLQAGDPTTIITGFTFDAKNTDTGGGAILVLIGGGLDAFRFHHSEFINLGGTGLTVAMDGLEVSGLVDHVRFHMPGGGSKAIRLFGTGSGEHQPFSRPFEPGSEKFIFFEDNTFDFDESYDGALDAFGGARYVFRYNTVNNTNVGHHGADSGGYRGIHSFEIYENTFTRTAAGNVRAHYFRSGSGVVFNNTYTGNYYDAITLTIYRSDESFGDWGKCDGTSIWDENQEGRNGYACLDQSGHIFTDVSGGVNTLVGMYEWNNILNGADLDFSINGHASGPYFTEGVDYFNDMVRPGYTPYVYPHPLVSGATPPPDTTSPSVSITSPTSGSTLSGTVTISASASDNVGIAGVQFKIDGSNIGVEDTTSLYSVLLNTTTLTDGLHTLIAVARDTSNNLATSLPITINVNSTIPDTTPPTASPVCSPSTVTIGDPFPCTCSGSDNIAVNSTSKSSTSGSTSGTSVTGTFTYTCIVKDTSGNSASATEIYTVVQQIVSGGGGSVVSRGGGIIMEETTSIPENNYSWTRIMPGVATIIKDFNSETGVKQIQIEVSNEAQNVKLTVIKYDDKPAEVSIVKTGKVYQYLQIEATNLADKLEKAIVKFRVEKSWIANNDLQKEKVEVHRFDESSENWNKLTITYAEEDTNYFYYDSELNSLSYFVILVPDEEEKRNLIWWVLIVLSVLVIIIVLVAIGRYIRAKKQQTI